MASETTRKGLHEFNVDIEATKAYYKDVITLCDCKYCRLFHKKAKKYTVLDAFLSEYGVDIAKPDEVFCAEHENYVEYICVDYTVCGTMTPGTEHKTVLCENPELRIFINPGFVCPNQQSGEYFTISVEGITLDI